MSITALYVFTPTEFAVTKPSRIDQLRKDSSSHGATARYTAVTMEVASSFTLQPGVYRAAAGVSISPCANAVAAKLSSADVAAPVTGYAICPILDTKTNWPDPPARRASAVLGIPLDAMGPFLNDTGDSSTISAP